MKNLKVLVRIKTNFDANIIANCMDADNKRYFALTEDFDILESQDKQLQAKSIEHDFDKSQYEFNNLTRDDVILMEYVVEIGSILIILVTGHFIHIGVSSFSPPSDCQYKHDKRISSVKISPDQDLIVMADESDGLLMLQINNYANIIHSTNALTENDSLHKPVGVGWGSKETQFFGLDGRPAKESNSKTIDPSDVIDDEKIRDSDNFKKFKFGKDKSTLIDWRGDGQLIATLTYISESKKHYLKVWNRNLELQYMSEQLITMEGGLLSWIPNGQYVCCGQRRDGGINDIVMFEKNGMVHQRVTLPTIIHNLYISNLSWSPDSKILAILAIQFARDEFGNVKKKYILMLYTMQNFRYYLKFSTYLTCETGNFIRWDPINHYKLYVSSLTGLCQEYDCSFTVTHSQDHSTVAVVDGDKLMITPFSICNIPPPMSAIRIEFNSLISRIILGSESVKNLVILTMDNRIIYVPNKTISQTDRVEYCSLDLRIKSEPIKNFKGKLEYLRGSDIKNVHHFQNFTPINEGFLVATNQVGYDCQIYKINMNNPEAPIKPLQTIIRKQVISIAQNYKVGKKSFLFLDDGSCMELDVESGDVHHKFSLESAIDRLHIQESHYVESSGTGKVISLTQDNTLRANEHILSSNSCTSFRVSENFLVYTTTDNNLHFVAMSKILREIIPAEVESYSQPIETGGTLTLVSEKDSKVILQMPRGNLEILHPRILVLLSVSHHLNQKAYLNALKEARRHRVDLNFLRDYLIQLEGDHFFEHTLNEFVLEIVQHDQSFLNLFINDLKDENTIFGRYSTIMRCLPYEDLNLDSKPADCAKGKVHKVCSSVDLDRVLSWNCYLQSHILCLIRQQPTKIGPALEVISRCGDVKSGLNFLLYYIDIEQLFLEALATYNTNLALMVANASTKDPKEYLALLDKFNDVPDEYLRRFEIDMHVKNYEKAFQDLLLYHGSQKNDNGNPIDRMISLMESKRIYKFATRCIEKHDLGSELECQLWVKYADYLLEKRYHLEAGLAYWRGTRSYGHNPETFDKAMNCLLLVEDWERCALIMKGQDISSSKRLDYTKKISDQLLSRGKFTEALIVRHGVVEESELAVSIAARGNLNLASIIAPELSELAPHQLITIQVQEQCASWESEFTTAHCQFARLKELITTHQTRRLNNLDGDNCYSSDSLSTIDGSDASSILSGGAAKQKVARSGAPSIKTRASSKSSKSRAGNAKKINLKTGSRHEDIAIVLELKKFVAKQKSNHELARQMLATDTMISKISVVDSHKESFIETLSKSLNLAQDIVSSLWPSNEQEDPTYSLYRRFSNLFSSSETVLENVDFLVLVKPEAPKELILLEI